MELNRNHSKFNLVSIMPETLLDVIGKIIADKH